MMEELWDVFYLKALVMLCVVVGLIWVASFVLRKFYSFCSRQKVSKLVHVLDSYQLDVNRRIVIFGCPFGQGLLLLSPKSDQILMFPHQASPVEPRS